MQRAPTSCSPPRGVAANCATRRAAGASLFLSGSGCARRGWAERLSTQARRPFITSAMFGLSPIPPEALRAWATRPAVRGTALFAFGLSGRSLRGPKRALRVASRPRGGFSPRDSASRKSTAQPTAQNTAPCRPHCGSAYAPPHSRRPLGFHLDFAITKRAKSLFRRAGDGVLRGIEFFRAPVLCPRALRDSVIFGYRRNS